MKIKKISFESELYPEQLRSIDEPPQLLYVLGNEKILNGKNLSIVGSRNASEYGKNIAKQFSKNISKYGINIVSGMAKGIDSIAHLGAIEEKKNTIAVLGSGFNYIFPDKTVFEKILENGGTVITEYEPNTKVFANGFRKRNRIIAGLSIGTLVVEAKEKSGTSITAKYTQQYGRKLFCIPHTIEDKHGVGTNRLIKNGAILVTDINDILQYFDITNTNIIPDKVEVPKEYEQIYKLIETNPINADAISKKTGKNISEVNSILTMLELEGFIKYLPGNYFYKER